MKILLLEPFFSGSHRQWATGWQTHSLHDIEIISLPGRHWKWRMFGGAASLAKKVLDAGYQPDLLLASDMLDLSTFLGFWHQQGQKRIPVILYFHENQITYPWSPKDQQLERNAQYGFINFTSAIAADAIWFNSDFHRNEFKAALPEFLKKYPDFQNMDQLTGIQEKSSTKALGLDLKSLDKHQESAKENMAVLLWNHRWEYDKDPDTFFRLCFDLKRAGVSFKLVVLGAAYQKQPPIFEKARLELAQEILHWGYAESREAYAEWLWRSDIIPVTSRQDFFGGSTVEAIYCQNYPILPNRLAFPEHLPTNQKKVNLYDNYENLFQKTLNAINQLDKIRTDLQYRHFVARYDWSVKASEYDAALEKFNSNTFRT